jgi:hypothetical protein
MRRIIWLPACLGLLAFALVLILGAAPDRSLAARPPEPAAPAGSAVSGSPRPRDAVDPGERGLHVHPNELPGQVATIAAAGTGWVRLEFIKQPDGTLDLAKYDTIVDSLTDNDMAVIGLVDYVSLPEDLDGDRQKDYDDPEDYLAYQQRFTETVQALATHFQGTIRHWEIWNEENGGLWHIRPEYYARLLVKCAEVLKAVDAENQVIFGGLDHVWVTSQYLEPVYDALDQVWAGARPFDILAVHPYFVFAAGQYVLDPNIYLWDGGDPPRTKLDAYLDLMAARGDGDVDIWITEIGWNSALDNPAIDNCPGMRAWCVDRITQASYLHDSLDILLGEVEDPEGNRNRVRTVVWYQYHDTTTSAAELAKRMGIERRQIAADPQAICPADWGFVDGNRQPKLSYWAYQSYTRPLTDVTVLSFTAKPRPAAVLLAWETAAEIGLAGFNLYRVESPGGSRVQLNGDPIPAQSPGGASYTYLDTAVALSTTYTYTLVAIVNGSPVLTYGPASAMPEEPPPPPPLLATNDSPTPLGLVTTLTATLSTTNGVTLTEGVEVTFTWAFGDGEGGAGAVVTHTYGATGIYTAVVTATLPYTYGAGGTAAMPYAGLTATLPITEVTATTPVTITASTLITITEPHAWLYLPQVRRSQSP